MAGKRQPRKRFHLTVEMLGIMLAVLGLIIVIVGHLNQYGGIDPAAMLRDFYANLGAELASIAVTVLIIDRLHERRERESRTERLVWELSSKDNRTALYAAEMLRADGLLGDGTLRHTDLKYANLADALLPEADLHAAYLSFAVLTGADLRGADLSEAILREANLQNALLIDAELGGAKLLNADLSGANLHGVRLAGTNLSGARLDGARGLTDTSMMAADRMAGAVLPTGKIYDGRYNLPGDLESLPANDDEAAAAFYGVSVVAYRKGQAWYQNQQDDSAAVD